MTARYPGDPEEEVDADTLDAWMTAWLDDSQEPERRGLWRMESWIAWTHFRAFEEFPDGKPAHQQPAWLKRDFGSISAAESRVRKKLDDEREMQRKVEDLAKDDKAWEW